MRRFLVAAVVLATASCSSAPRQYRPADVISIYYYFASPLEGTITRPRISARDSGFPQVVQHLPDPIPRPERSRECNSATLDLGMRDGRTVSYGPCDNSEWSLAVFDAMQSLQHT